LFKAGEIVVNNAVYRLSVFISVLEIALKVKSFSKSWRMFYVFYPLKL